MPDLSYMRALSYMRVHLGPGLNRPRGFDILSRGSNTHANMSTPKACVRTTLYYKRTQTQMSCQSPCTTTRMS